jgi:imidazoleglycerol phosphate dehydratase HisB
MDRDSLAAVATALHNVAGLVAEVQRHEGQGSPMDAAQFEASVDSEASRLISVGEATLAETVAEIKAPIVAFLSNGQ